VNKHNRPEFEVKVNIEEQSEKAIKIEIDRWNNPTIESGAVQYYLTGSYGNFTLQQSVTSQQSVAVKNALKKELLSSSEKIYLASANISDATEARVYRKQAMSLAIMDLLVAILETVDREVKEEVSNIELELVAMEFAALHLFSVHVEDNLTRELLDSAIQRIALNNKVVEYVVANLKNTDNYLRSNIGQQTKREVK